jgi:hypothetical protein
MATTKKTRTTNTIPVLNLRVESDNYNYRLPVTFQGTYYNGGIDIPKTGILFVYSSRYVDQIVKDLNLKIDTLTKQISRLKPESRVRQKK